MVDTDGKVKNAKILREIGGGFDKEALRAVRNLIFEPGKQRGKSVQVRMTIPVVIQLQ
ncbi:energy transducer TonB [Fodinibius salinus]|uniref:energy transducer TonB n=1 Tax=Fodinibius salinus TaxID=860790 RepID=UPI001478EE9A|nr:energy transducer TonB [Fodinibius salinus]